MNNRLTICIPTYDRNACVLQAIEKLLPQITGECSLVVLDNHSADDPSEDILRLFQRFPEARCKLIRHPVNVGAAANVLRCFEMAESGWLWICGDDDKPLPNSVSNILRAADEYPDALYINFVSVWLQRGDQAVRKESLCLNRANFFQKLDGFSNLLYISTGIYHVERAQQCLRMGYIYAHTHAMQVAMILHGLEIGHRVALHSSQIIEWGCDETTAWDPQIIWFTYGVLDCISRAPDREAFRRLMKVGAYVTSNATSRKMRLLGLCLTEEPIAFRLHQYLLFWPGSGLLYGSTKREVAASCAKMVWETCYFILALTIRKPLLSFLKWWDPGLLEKYKQDFARFDLHQLRFSNRI